MATIIKDHRAKSVETPTKPEVLLIAMTKNGAALEVHPSCVQAHQSAGWQLA